MKSASHGNDFSDERSVLKHCVTQFRNSSSNPPNYGCHKRNGNIVIWSNPTFWCSDEAQESSVVGRNNIVENARYINPSPPTVVFAFNVSDGGRRSEVVTSNPMKREQKKKVIPKRKPEVRNTGRMSEAEAKIRAELAREIEDELEFEIEQQIAILTRRLQQLRAHRKAQTHANTDNKLSSGSCCFRRCSSTDLLQPRHPHPTLGKTGSRDNCRNKDPSKNLGTGMRSKLYMTDGLSSADQNSRAMLLGAQLFNRKQVRQNG